MLLPASLSAIARLLPSPLYVVGGWVRNQLAYGGPRGTDIDIASALTPQEVKAVLSETPVKVVDVNPRIGTVLLTLGGDSYEYTAFRRDSYPLGGVHTPEAVTFVRDIQEDACRRDFRCNAVYWDIARGCAVDPLDGIEDIRNHLIRTTRTPKAVFGEDGLRILRLVRLAARLGWEIEQDTLSTAYEMRAMLRDISWERRREEFDAILTADRAYGNAEGLKTGLDLLSRLKLWPYLVGYEPAAPLVEAACRIDGDWDVRLAALLVDRKPNELLLILGKDGLRYSNKQVKAITHWIALYQGVQTDTPLPLVAADCDEDVLRSVTHLLAAFDKDDLACRLAETRAKLLANGVTLVPQGLAIEATKLSALGIPDKDLGKALAYVVEQGILMGKALTEDECMAYAKRYKEEHLC